MKCRWFGEVPENWLTMPLGAVADCWTSNVDKRDVEGEHPVRLCNYTDVYKNDYVHPRMDLMLATASEQEIARFGLLSDDVIITKDSESSEDIGVPALVTETADDFVCGYHLALLRPKKEVILGRFLFRLLQSRPVQLQMELAAKGVTRFGLSKFDIRKTLLPVPSLSTQATIADYVDRETAAVDRLVATKQRLLDLLAEKRRAAVTHAVTRGIDAHVPTKDAGVPWLGDIPAHWQTERARWLFRERDQRSDDGTEELLTVSHLTGVTPRSEKDVNMFEAETLEGYKLCKSGDLVINTLWAWMGAMGVSFVQGVVSPSYHVYTPTERMDPGYVDALSRVNVFAQEVVRHSKGVWSSRLRLYPDGFFNIHLPVPPLSEQQKIAAFLEVECKKLDDLRAATVRTIELLRERRAALISAAVTGDIAVGDDTEAST